MDASTTERHYIFDTLFHIYTNYYSSSTNQQLYYIESHLSRS